jgi:conjugal transfer pilin signal peptidase TrbI
MASHTMHSTVLKKNRFRLVRRLFDMRGLFQHMRHRWYIYLFLLLIWSLAFVRVFINPTPYLPVLFNVTPSLPCMVALVQYGSTTYGVGDYVVFTFSGEAQQHYPGLKHQPFFKIIRGVAGDRITVRDRHVYVNDIDMGYAKTHSFDRLPLEPLVEMVIPPGHYYMQGTSPDSFDSRYRLSGLVRTEQIIGKVKPLF